MTGLPVNITDEGRRAEVHRRNGDTGLKVFTEELQEKEILFSFALNPELGFEMNIDGTFGGTPVGIHDGTDSVEWAATNISGAKVTFDSTDQPQAGTKSVKVNKPAVSNVWQFDKGSDLTVANYVAFSMFIYVTSGWTVGNSISMYGFDTGTGLQVGTAIALEDYFNEQQFGVYQKLSIPFTDMNLTADIDSIRMECTDKSGSGILCYMDEIQVEETSGAQKFQILAPKGTKYFVDELRFTFIDALSTTLVANSMHNLSYNTILGVSKLTNGIGFARVKAGQSLFSASVTCLTDSTRGGAEVVNAYSDGTNTHVTLLTDFRTSVLLDSRTADSIDITINDDLTGLISFTCVVKGYTVDL